MHQMAWNRTSERLAVLFKGICLYFSEIVVSCVQETSFVMKYKKHNLYAHTYVHNNTDRSTYISPLQFQKQDRLFYNTDQKLDEKSQNEKF